MIKAVIFDLGGVYFTDGTKIAIDKISKRYHLNRIDVENMLKAGSKTGILYRRGTITANEFWLEFKKKFSIRTKNSDLTKFWNGAYKPIRGTVKIVKELRRKRIQTHFLSDNVKERVNSLQKTYRFMENFNDGVFSYKVNNTKADGTAVFKMALEKTKNKPNEVIFIDDKESYVETAKKLGMKGIIFKNPKQLNTELKKFIK